MLCDVKTSNHQPSLSPAFVSVNRNTSLLTKILYFPPSYFELKVIRGLWDEELSWAIFSIELTSSFFFRFPRVDQSHQITTSLFTQSALHLNNWLCDEALPSVISDWKCMFCNRHAIEKKELFFFLCLQIIMFTSYYHRNGICACQHTISLMLVFFFLVFVVVVHSSSAKIHLSKSKQFSLFISNVFEHHSTIWPEFANFIFTTK